MAPHKLTQQEARRIAVRAQLLDATEPPGLSGIVRHLTLLQNDLTAYVAPSADLVLWGRLGSAYRPSDLRDELDAQTLIELHGMIRPAADIALHRADMDDWPGRGDLTEWQEHRRDWVHANRGCRLDILARLRADGPLPARELPDTCAVPWQSSGWSNDRNVSRLLGFMVARGEVALSGFDGRERLWDLAERVYPDEPAVPAAEARRVRGERMLTALGIARGRASGDPDDVSAAGEPAVVEGLRGSWRVDPAQLGRPFEGRTVLLSPLDRLIFDRKRMTEIFGFDYQLEMYKPVAKRRWGYWALPVLHGDRLVGKVDAEADRAARRLRVHAVHLDDTPTPALREAVNHEITRLAAWLGLTATLPKA